MAKGTATDPFEVDDYNPAPKAAPAPAFGRRIASKATSSRRFNDSARGTADDPVSLEDDSPARPKHKSSTPAQSEHNASPTSHQRGSIVVSDNDSDDQARENSHVPLSGTKNALGKSIPQENLQGAFSRANVSRSGAANASGNTSATPGRLSSQSIPVARQSPIVDPTNATNATETAQAPSTGPELNPTNVGLPVPLPMGYHSTPETENIATETEGSGISKPQVGRQERTDATPTPFTQENAEPVAHRSFATAGISIGSPKAQDTHTPSVIPIRSTVRPMFSPTGPASDAHVPASPRARLAYVMNPGSVSSAPRVVPKLGSSSNSNVKTTPPPEASVPESKQSLPKSNPSGSKQPIRKELQSDKPVSSSLAKPLKAAQARKCPSNLGPKRLIRAPPSSLRASSLNAPVSPIDTDTHSAQAMKQDSGDQARGAIQEPAPPSSFRASSLNTPGPSANTYGAQANANLETTQEPTPVARTPPPSEHGLSKRSAMQVGEDSSGEHNSAATDMAQADALNLEVTTKILDDRLREHLQEVRQNHAQRVRNCMRRQRFRFEREGLLKERSIKQGRASIPAQAGNIIQSSSPFKNMQPIQTFVDNKGAKSPYFSQEIFTKARIKKGIASKMKIPVTKYRSTAVFVPAYRSYVSLQDSVLAENEKNMLNWPYFHDDFGEDMVTELEEAYRMKNVTHKWHALLSEFHEFYGPSTDALLADIGLAWEDVLFWYLAPESNIEALNNSLDASADFQRVLLRRKIGLDDTFDRSAPKWKRLFKNLPEPTPRKLRLAALVCLAFLKQNDFDLWHIARRSEFIQKEISRRLEGNREGHQEFDYSEVMCRVCQMHNCVFHGELREYPENSHQFAPDTQITNSQVTMEGASDNEHARSEDDEYLDDSEIEDVDNYRRAANTHTLAPYSPDEYDDQRQAAKPLNEFKAQWWMNNSSATTWEERKPFYPCSHDGTCDQAQCRCFVENITCEKSCECSLLCRRRFPGCSCAQLGGKQRICGTKACVCYVMSRECDGDLCGGCGATEILDPINRYNKDVSKDKCCNVALQRGVQKKTLLGHSEVHGFGLFTGEDVKKGDFLGEYKGEAVTLNEGARRGIVYEKQNTMYLFKLNKGRFVFVREHGTC